MYLCILDHGGQIVLHQNLGTDRDASVTITLSTDRVSSGSVWRRGEDASSCKADVEKRHP
jgi:hypothetical protein